MLRLARRLSDDLLAVEQETKAKVEAEFSKQIPSATKRLIKAFDAGLLAAHVQVELLDGLLLDLDKAIGGAQKAHEALFKVAVDNSLDGIGRELKVCESTLSRLFEGLADQAVSDIAAKREQWVALGVQEYSKVNDEAQIRFLDEAGKTMRVSVQQEEPVDALVRRFFYPDQVRLTGHSGRGAWWKPYQDLNARVRDVEFQLVNGIRKAAMTQFSRIYRGRDG